MMQRFDLERFGIDKALSTSLLRNQMVAQVTCDETYQARLKLEAFVCGKCETVKHTIETTIPAFHAAQYLGRMPEDWWQALKERFAPTWFKLRYPVRYKDFQVVFSFPEKVIQQEVSLDLFGLYPSIPVPGHKMTNVMVYGCDTDPYYIHNPVD